MATSHGNTNSYLHGFKIIEAPTCCCGTRDQNIDHLLFQCELLGKGRAILKQARVKLNHWPTSKQDLLRDYYKEIRQFTTQVPFDEINMKQIRCKANSKIVNQTAFKKSGM